MTRYKTVSSTQRSTHTRQQNTSYTMHISALLFAGLAAAAPSTLIARNHGRPDFSGSYWDATISAQSGRPGYSIRDLTTTFHRAGTEHTLGGTCHYSFVPQGTSPPAETDRCDSGLSYDWDCKSTLCLHLYPTLSVIFEHARASRRVIF